MLECLTLWELDLIHTLTDDSSLAQDIFWTGVTYFGEGGLFWIGVSLFLITHRKTRKLGLTVGLALLFGVILGNGILKNLIARPRPYVVDPTLVPRLARGEMSGDFSFPSGHTLASFEAATVIFFYHKKWGTCALFLAVLVAFSRLFLAVHFPTDLLAGALLGIGIAYLSRFAVDRAAKKIGK